jgi:hypothetical protein
VATFEGLPGQWYKLMTAIATNIRERAPDSNVTLPQYPMDRLDFTDKDTLLASCKQVNRTFLPTPLPHIRFDITPFMDTSTGFLACEVNARDLHHIKISWNSLNGPGLQGLWPHMANLKSLVYSIEHVGVMLSEAMGSANDHNCSCGECCYGDDEDEMCGDWWENLAEACYDKVEDTLEGSPEIVFGRYPENEDGSVPYFDATPIKTLLAAWESDARMIEIEAELDIDKLDILPEGVVCSPLHAVYGNGSKLIYPSEFA